MKTPLKLLISITSLLLLLTAALTYILASHSPPHMVTRIQLVLLAAALIGIPLGIRLGTQDKFWT